MSDVVYVPCCHGPCKVLAQSMASLNSYRDLEVWNKAIGLIVSVYRLSSEFPSDEKYGLTRQVRRSAASVAANIAEGAGRSGNREYLRFLGIAHGSLAETDTHLVVTCELGITRKDQVRPIQEQIEEIGRMLTGLKRSLRTQL